MVEPAAAASHHSGVLVAMGCLETAAQLGWKKLDPTLRWLAVQTTASRIGCSWCIDYGYYEGITSGMDPAKVRAASKWREAISSTTASGRSSSTPRWRPEPVGGLGGARGPRQASPQRSGVRGVGGLGRPENFRSRFNAGLGLRSQGFSDRCDVELPDVAVA